MHSQLKVEESPRMEESGYEGGVKVKKGKHFVREAVNPGQSVKMSLAVIRVSNWGHIGQGPTTGHVVSVIQMCVLNTN